MQSMKYRLWKTMVSKKPIPPQQIHCKKIANKQGFNGHYKSDMWILFGSILINKYINDKSKIKQKHPYKVILENVISDDFLENDEDPLKRSN